MARSSHWRRWIAGVCLALSWVALASAPNRAAASGIVVVEIEGVIGIAASRQISAGLDAVRRTGAAYLVVRLDTPGGLVSSTREIVKEILGAPVPVIVYVAPSGARAASAGTFIVYASHVAAMAPGTNIGAATPIQLGGLPGIPSPADPGKDEKSEPATTSQTAAERKAINDTVAMLRSLAQMRGRNVEWAEKAVRDAATLTADEALGERVIDAVARDLDDLLARIDGRTVAFGGGEHKIATKDLPRTTLAPDWRTRLLGVISDPNLAFILLLIGVYGILFEFWNPGALVPGIVGAISLILALTALSTLPVQYGALGLVILGIGLMVAEAFTPGLGILGLGGAAAFVAGALFLFDPGGADFEIAVALPLIVAAAATSAALVLFVLGAAIKARRRPAMTGAEQMIGSVGQVVTWSGTAGRVRVHGEIWAARAERPLTPGENVQVVRRDELTLLVASQ